MPRYIDRPNLHPRGFNPHVELPYGLRSAEVRAGIEDIYDFLYNVNRFLTGKGWHRLEETLSGAAFSGMMSELVVQSMATQSASLVRNARHNGRPDLLPRGIYEGDAVLVGSEGIEVKASRYASGWQGHNAETGWVMVFQYEIDLISRTVEEREPTKLVRVLIAKLGSADWSESGRGPGSRRTPTASILRSGMEKLLRNPVYLDPAYERRGSSSRRG
jgi:hypothetical protein